VPRKIISTLTSSISNYVHTSISPIFLYNLCSVAIVEHSKPLPLENYVRIVALAPDLQTIPLCGATEFLHHSSTTELLSLLILIKSPIRALRPNYHTGNRHQPCGCCGTQIHGMSPRGSVLIIKATNNFWLVRNDLTRPIIITT
jgi:hypothetical protein